ncbi:MAG: hypothetical protein DIU78_019100 [Pseudomonadota bacterium]
MLSPSVRVHGFSSEEWTRLAEVVRPPFGGTRSDHGARFGVVAVASGERLQALASTRSVAIDTTDHPWPLPLEELAARHRAAWAARLSEGSLERLANRFGARLRREDTGTSQLLELLGILRELEREGELAVWPWPIAEWPIPTERAVVRALDALCPPDHVALLGVFHGGDLYTALALRRGALGIEALVGPSELRSEMGLLSGDFSRDYFHLAEAARQLVGPLALGCFGELATFQSLADGPAPGAWTTAVVTRDIVLEPAPIGVSVPLGLDAGRALLGAVRGLVSRLGADTWLRGLDIAAALERGLPLFEGDVVARLGFDPLRLLGRLLARR